MNLPKYNPDPTHIRSLVERCGLSQRAVASAIGVSPRSMRYFLAPVGQTGVNIPETVYYKLYCLALLNEAGRSENHVQLLPGRVH